eukprot:30143-Hanusia_phi.AAC.5
METLSKLLQSQEFADRSACPGEDATDTDLSCFRVQRVQFATKKGNSARFNNLSLYIRISCLKSWCHEPTAQKKQDNVYVNVYESGTSSESVSCPGQWAAGKCSVLAVPNSEVAEELADVVSELLYRSLRKVSCQMT